MSQCEKCSQCETNNKFLDGMNKLNSPEFSNFVAELFKQDNKNNTMEERVSNAMKMASESGLLPEDIKIDTKGLAATLNEMTVTFEPVKLQLEEDFNKMKSSN